MIKRGRDKLKDLLKDKKSSPEPYFRVPVGEGKRLAEVHVMPMEEAIEGVTTCWNRSVQKVLTQLGKDLPRFANKITFTTSNDVALIQESFNQLCPRKSFFLDSPQLQDDSHDIFQSLEHVSSLTNKENHLYELKTILLLLAKFLENKGANSDPFQYVSSNFDEKFSHSVDLSSECAYFLEKSFLEENENCVTQFPLKSTTLNIARTLTQGHFSSVTTAFQCRLGMANITGNVHHQIYVVLPDGDEHDSEISVIHYKAEAGSWGNMKWMLSSTISPDGSDLRKIDFNIFELQFDDGIDVLHKEEILKALEPFLAPHVLFQLGLPIDYTLRSYSDEILEEKMESLAQMAWKEAILDYNHFSVLPRSIVNLAGSLVAISLVKNKFVEFPMALCELLQLRKINLGMNEIQVIPKEIASLKNLEKLLMSRNKIHTIPEEIQELENLSYLALASNQIEELPIQCLLKLNIQTFTIHNNPISASISTKLEGKEKIRQFLSINYN